MVILFIISLIFLVENKNKRITIKLQLTKIRDRNSTKKPIKCIIKIKFINHLSTSHYVCKILYNTRIYWKIFHKTLRMLYTLSSCIYEHVLKHNANLTKVRKRKKNFFLLINNIFNITLLLVFGNKPNIYVLAWQ